MSGWPKTTSYKERRCVLDSNSFVCYSVPTFKGAASSMAEQETLNFKVQGSTPWQPTSHTISPKRYPILPQICRAGANVSRLP